MDNREEEDIIKCDIVVNMIKRAVRMRINEIEKDICQKYTLSPTHIKLLPQISKNPELYNLKESYDINCVLTQCK